MKQSNIVLSERELKIINQLIGSFQIDISYTKEKTGWIPKKMISIK